MDIRNGDMNEIDVVNLIVRSLGITGGSVVEIGAWDGRKHSNILHLIEQGWTGILIEGDPEKFNALVENMRNFGIKCVRQMVSLEQGHTINDIVEHNFDLFSLDIDGYDYWIWKDLAYKPKIVIVEYNSNWEEEATIAYDPHHCWEGTQYFGASASALFRLGESLGYDLVGFTKFRNLFFIRKDVNSLPPMCREDLSGCIQRPHHREMSAFQKRSIICNPHLRKLHLGCGEIHIPGFINIDVQERPGVDVVADIRTLHPRRFPPGSVDLIYASHVLEHVGRWDFPTVLRRWHGLLKDNGVLRLAVPDLHALSKIYLETGDLSLILGPLYGGQHCPGGTHYWGWDQKTLSRDLFEAGFSLVRSWDWRTTEHSFVDDFSQAYVPHMQKDTGTLISLNLEAVK